METVASQTKKEGLLSVMLAAALWGTIGLYSKELIDLGFSTLQLVLVRAVGAFLTLLLLVLLKNPALLRIAPRDSIYFVGTGILSFVFFNWCYFTAISKTSLSVAAILLYTAPSIVMLLSALLFHEAVTRGKLCSLGLTFVGCVLVTALAPSGQPILFSGVLAGLGSGFGYALYSIFGRYALQRYHPLTVTLYTFFFASLALIPMVDFGAVASLLTNGKALGYGLALSVLATVLPFLLYTKGLSKLEAGKASILATLEPVVATMIGIGLYQEPLSLVKVLGIAIVMLGVYLSR